MVKSPVMVGCGVGLDDGCGAACCGLDLAWLSYLGGRGVCIASWLWVG